MLGVYMYASGRLYTTAADTHKRVERREVMERENPSRQNEYNKTKIDPSTPRCNFE